MGVEICTSKFFLFIVGLIYWGIAAGFAFLGISIVTEYGHIDEIAKSDYTLVPGFTLIGAAVLMVIIGIFMCVSSCTKNKCVLATVFCILLFIFLAEASAAVMGFAYRRQAEKMIKDGLTDAFNDYGNPNHTSITHEIDYVQEKFDCCGFENNFTDWRNLPWGKAHRKNATVPESCCKEEFPHCYFSNHTYVKNATFTDQIHTEGCYSTVRNKLEDSLGILVGVALGFALLQILGMISACVLLCRTNSGSGYATLREDQAVGLRV